MTDDLAAWLLEQIAEHMARLGRAQALAECDAKRRIINDLWFAGQVAEVYDAAGGLIAGGANAVNDVLKHLALPYADRPGYREEWRP